MLQAHCQSTMTGAATFQGRTRPTLLGPMPLPSSPFLTSLFIFSPPFSYPPYLHYQEVTTESNYGQLYELFLAAKAFSVYFGPRKCVWRQLFLYLLWQPECSSEPGASVQTTLCDGTYWYNGVSRHVLLRSTYGKGLGQHMMIMM